MSVTQYIGARYVPLFADPIAWDITQQYEPLTIVYYQGNSYTSKQAVPSNIDISNTDYWALTGNYNAQIEQYRTEVQTYDNRITANTTSNTAQDAQLAGTSNSGLKTLIDANTSSNTSQDAQLAGTSNSGLKTLIDANASDIDTLESQMAGTVSSGLKTLIENSVSAFSSATEYENAVSVAFGDSNMWGQTYTAQNIYSRVCDLIGCTYNNYALSGAGFERVNNVDSVIEQIQAENDVNPDDVKLVLIMAGINDFHYGSHNTSTFQSAVSDALNAAIAKYQNAKIVSMFDSGSQMPDGTFLRYELGLARQTQRKERCIYVPLADLCTQANLWENQNHYNDAGAEIVAGRIKNTLMGGTYAPANGTRYSKAYTLTDASDSGYYGFEVIVETYIDPVNLVRTDTIFLAFTGGGLNNVDSTKTATVSGEVLCKIPIWLPRFDYSSTRGLLAVPMQKVSSGTVTAQTLMLTLYDVQRSGYSQNPEAEIRFRFNSDFSNYSNMVGAISFQFETTQMDI